ncbi:MAG: FHA domain-containing protein [Rubripirellula sp.]
MIATSDNAFLIKLTAQDEMGSTRSFELHSDQGVFVGQSSNCGLQIRGEGIGDIHCRIGFDEGKLMVQDWMSSGTRVNGKAIESSVDLDHGDVVQIGSHRISIGPTTEQTSDAKASVRCEEIQMGTLRESTSDASLPKHEQELHDGQSEPESIEIFGRDADPLPTETENGQAAIDLEETASPTVGDSGGWLNAQTLDFASDFTELEDEQTFDRETVDLLRAEIEELQAALAQQDACGFEDVNLQFMTPQTDAGDAGMMEQRIKELIEEANRSDERVCLLEEMLHAAEDANRNEREERNQLEAWVSDIESRITQREEESAAEIEMLHSRLEEANQEQDRLRRKLGQAAVGGNAPSHYEETLEDLQRLNRELQIKFDQSQKQQHILEQRLEESAHQQENLVREERAQIAKEQARLSRLRFELSSKVADVESLPKEANEVEIENSGKIRALREHLREIHEQEKKKEAEASLTSRLAKMWKRVEY